MKPTIAPLCVITDTCIQHRYSHLELTQAALKGGAKLIQFRDRLLSDEDFLNTAIELKACCKNYQAQLIINDRVELAIKCQADGVHLGQADMPISEARRLAGKNMLIGQSVSNPNEAQSAEKEGASYIGLGHIFKTSTKHKENPPIGLEAIQTIRQLVSLPIMAIGGITGSTAQEVLRAGADSLAVVSSICKAENPELATKSFLNLIG